MKIEPRTLKGFRDFLPKDARKRSYVLEILKKVFESYGFEPLETPALEYEDILAGKYGAEGDKLMYRFTDNGDRKVALRYDQTVPLARVVAQYQNELPMPFKRYQIQNVWRAENTQRGRYREFLQVDADIVGSYSPLSDTEVITLVAKCLEKLKFENFNILVNDRKTFQTENFRTYFKTGFDVPNEKLDLVIRIFDKYSKIGKEGVKEEFLNAGFSENETNDLLKNIDEEIKLTPNLEQITSRLEPTIKSRIKPMKIARGLDYYTGLIFEVEVDGYDVGSIAGGGRYDNLIGMFAGRGIPAVGFAFGFDRLIEAMETLNLFPANLYTTKVLVAFANSELQEKALKITDELRSKEINSEVYPEDASLEKQLKYADKKQVPYVVIINDKGLMMKDMNKRTQEELTLSQILEKLK